MAHMVPNGVSRPTLPHQDSIFILSEGNQDLLSGPPAQQLLGFRFQGLGFRDYKAEW